MIIANPATRGIFQPLIYGLGPGFENLFTLLMAKRVKTDFDAGARDFESVTYAEAIGAAMTLEGMGLAEISGEQASLRSAHASAYAAAKTDGLT